jgi:hypothetical protein
MIEVTREKSIRRSKTATPRMRHDGHLDGVMESDHESDHSGSERCVRVCGHTCVCALCGVARTLLYLLFCQATLLAA